MAKPRKSMDNVIRFPVESIPKYGFERVKAPRKRSRAERAGQIDMFDSPAEPSRPGQVVELPTRIGLFEEALLLDEQGSDRAAGAYWKAIEEEDHVADAYCNLGIMESRKGRTSKSIDCFTNSLQHDPRHFESHFNVANMYFEAGDLKLARLHYEVAAEIEPDFPNVYFNLGLVAAMAGDYATAVGSLETYQRLASDDEASKAEDLLASLKNSLTQQS